MIPTIDLNVYEWMMVRNNECTSWRKEKVFAVFSDGSCLCTENGKLRETGLENHGFIIDVLDKMFYAMFSRPIEKKIIPLESAFDIPSWCFGCTFNSGMSTLIKIFDKKTVLSLAEETYSLDLLAKTRQYITRDGFGRFNLYMDVEE